MHAVEDGYVEVEALVGRELVTARVRLCAAHLLMATGRRSFAAAA